MDGILFDRIAMRVSRTRVSRRTAVWSGLTGALASALAGNVARAQDVATPGATDAMAEDASTLFVQTATGGTFRPNPDAGATPAASASPVPGLPGTDRRGDWLLTLEGHSGETIAFSDRPQRNFSEVATDHFFESMGFTPTDPPNAALVAGTGEERNDVLILELMTPAFDADSQTLTYEADILEGYEGEGLQPMAARQLDQTMAEEFESASLFIDDCPDTSILCFTPTALLTCAPIGTVRGVGSCWHWECLCCTMCSGSPGDVCAANYPDQCGNGQCTGKTFSQYLQMCNVKG